MKIIDYPREVCRPGQQYSGTTYVRVWLKEQHPHGRPTLRESSRVKVKFAPGACDHSVTVCTECYESWALDYGFMFENTSAGRWLAVQVQA